MQQVPSYRLLPPASLQPRGRRQYTKLPLLHQVCYCHNVQVAAIAAAFFVAKEVAK